MCGAAGFSGSKMFKRLGNNGQLNSPKRYWNPFSVRGYLDEMKKLSGTDFGIVENTEVSLNFAVPAGGSETQSLPSKDVYWILTARRASITTLSGEQFRSPGLINVSSYVVSEDSNTNVILTEDQPIANMFGTGEWQEYQFIDYPANVNNRIFQIRNLSSDEVYVTLSFKALRIVPDELDRQA